MPEYFFCDTAGEPFDGQAGDNLGNFCAVAHDCPHCGQPASRGRTLAWLALECHAKGKAVFPCMSCGQEIEFPAHLFVPECLAKVATHFQPNALLRAMTPEEVLAANWGERLFQTNARQDIIGQIASPESGSELAAPGEPLGGGWPPSGNPAQSFADELDMSAGLLGEIERTTAADERAEDTDLGTAAEIGALHDLFEVPGRPEPVPVDSIGPSHEVLDLSAEPEPEIEFVESGLDQTVFDSGHVSQPDPARTASEMDDGDAAPPQVRFAPPTSRPPQRAWDGRAPCPACGFTGPPRQSQALDCAACGVHFWTRQENLDRAGDSHVTCPRCQCILVIPSSVWCATCGQSMPPHSTATAGIRVESTNAQQRGTVEKKAKRFRWR